jgi:hypothetical protein
MIQSEFTVNMRLVRTTPGAALYQELDHQSNQDVNQQEGRLNTMYGVGRLSLANRP